MKKVPPSLHDLRDLVRQLLEDEPNTLEEFGFHHKISRYNDGHGLSLGVTLINGSKYRIIFTSF